MMPRIIVSLDDFGRLITIFNCFFKILARKLRLSIHIILVLVLIAHVIVLGYLGFLLILKIKCPLAKFQVAVTQKSVIFYLFVFD